MPVKATLFSLKENNIKSKDNNVKSTPVLEMLLKQKDEIEVKLKRLYNLYADDADDTLLEIISEHKKKIKELNHKIEKEKIQSEKILNQIKKKRNITLDNLESKWDYMTLKEQQNIVRLLVDRITITGKEVEIKLSF